MTWDEMMSELRKEYPDVVGKEEHIAEQLSGYISKLDAYAILSEYYYHGPVAQREALMEALSRVPTADVVAVVRCRDCIRADAYGHCEMQNFWGTRDDFCSRGEKKETDND